MTLAQASALGLALLAGAGIAYTALAAALTWRMARTPLAPPPPSEPVTLLKPLHGAEPRLRDNLASFLDQRWDAPIELLAGVSRAEDLGAGALAGLRLAADRGARLVVTGPSGAANAKIGNVAGLARAAAHDLLVLSDSDMAVPRDYLAAVAGVLAAPGVGAVTCLYRGRGDAGLWSTLGAAAISYQFLPGVLVALALGAGAPCMGSTIALRRAVLTRIGGFERFADTLADDHAIGAAVRALGLEIAVPPLLLVHGCAETSFASLIRQELRWAATVRGVTPWPAHLGLAVTYPVVWALLAVIFAPAIGMPLIAAALASRVALAWTVDRWSGARTASRWLLPARDLLGFAVFCSSFLVRSVEWRGSRLTVRGAGRIVAE